MRFGRGRRAEHDVGMAADVFCKCQVGQVDPGREGLEQNRRCPGIIEQRDEAALLRNCADRRHVLDFHRLRAWTLEQDRARFLAEEVRNLGADQRIVVGGRNPVAFQECLAEFPSWTVDGVDHEQLVAGPKHGKQRRRDRRQARRIKRGPRSTWLELGEGFGERPLRRGSLEAVTIGPEPGPASFQIGDCVEQYCRRALDRRVDEASPPFATPSAFYENRRLPPVLVAHLRAWKTVGTGGTALSPLLSWRRKGRSIRPAR
jgi:hypothetical protein